MNMTWRYVNDITQTSINKLCYWLTLALLRVEMRSRSHDISMFGIEKCNATSLKMKILPFDCLNFNEFNQMPTEPSITW